MSDKTYRRHIHAFDNEGMMCNLEHRSKSGSGS